MEWAVVVFFAAWALVSVLVLIPRYTATIRGKDWLGMVPEWKFFAPIPGKGDFHFLFRDLYGEVIGDWTEEYVGGNRRWWNSLWNPWKRDRKAALDAARDLAVTMRAVPQSEIVLTVPYLALLTYVSGLSRTFPATHTQFMVLYSDPHLEQGVPQISLVSSVHALPEQVGR